MSEVVTRVAQAAGIDEELAGKAVEIIFNLVREHAPADKVRELFAQLPDADPADVPDKEESGGMLGGMLGGLGGSMGAMGALNEMTSAGLSMEQVQTVGKEVLAYSREHAGEDLVGEVIGSIPGLGQFL